MRTNIVIDDSLLADFMAASGAATKREAIETALREALAIRRQSGIRALRGTVEWGGDLDDMRTSKYVPADT